MIHIVYLVYAFIKKIKYIFTVVSTDCFFFTDLLSEPIKYWLDIQNIERWLEERTLQNQIYNR